MSNNIAFDKIICPKCGEEIPVSETILKQFSDKANQDADQKIRELETAFNVKQAALKKEEEQIKTSKENLEKIIQEKLQAQSKVQEIKIIEETQKQYQLQLDDLKQQSHQKDQKLEEAQKAQLEAINVKREFEEKAKTLDLEIAKKLEAERFKVKEAAEIKIQEEYHLKIAEKDKTINDVLRVNEELKRKLEQGSQQTQGEVKELQIEELLRISFPLDQIIPVAKGVRGADALQKVYNNYGNCCGTIIWECKRTKAWSDGWLTKLKEDQAEAQADVAVIVSDVLPKDCINFTNIDGVWITSNLLVKELATILRMQLAQVAIIKASNIGKNEKMESIYNYLTSPSFKHKVEGIMETFMQMKNDIVRERSAYERMWSKREKQIDKVLKNTSGMYGDIQGVIGTELSSIDLLELPEVDSDNLISD